MENRQQVQLSDVTKEYLDSYYGILDEMMRGMTGAELTDSISHNFMVQMIPHHEAAIRMSANILKYTTDMQLEQIAKGIIQEQTKSIADMRSILEECSRLENTPRDLALYQRRMNRIMQVMFARMESACISNRVNCDFMWEMIPHHEGAVEMSENTLLYDICPELFPILEAIITSQQRGIRQMQALLRQLGCVCREG